MHSIRADLSSNHPGEGVEAEAAYRNAKPDAGGACLEPTFAELARASNELQRIGKLLQDTGGKITPQMRSIIGDVLAQPHVRPASLAMLYTRYVRSVRNKEQEHRLKVALELLGSLMHKGVRSDPDAGAVLISIAEGLSPRRVTGKPTRGENIAVQQARRKKTSGRPGISAVEANRRTRIVAEWTQAKRAGISQKEFCVGKPYSLKDLTKYINWFAQRRHRGMTS